MKKCLFDKNIIERAEDSTEVMHAGQAVREIRNTLLATLSPEQRELFNAYDDAALAEGTARVNAAIRVACGCGECRNYGSPHI